MDEAAGLNTIDAGEINRFNALSGRWWETDGPFKALHRINPARLGFMRDQMVRHFLRDGRSLRPFEGLSLVDVGCGGGLVAEPLARMGFEVSGLDAASDALDAAQAHATEQRLNITYRHGAIEDLAAAGDTFDVVCALEIIEHTADPAGFVAALDTVVRPGGMIVMSTLNRTLRSYALGIVAAEWVLGWVPRGTHDWKKFVRPSELAEAARRAGWMLSDLSGLSYDAIRDRWSLSADLAVNYLAAFSKPAKGGRAA